LQIAHLDLPVVCRTPADVFFASGNVLFPFGGVLSGSSGIFLPLIRKSFSGVDPFSMSGEKETPFEEDFSPFNDGKMPVRIANFPL